MITIRAFETLKSRENAHMSLPVKLAALFSMSTYHDHHGHEKSMRTTASRDMFKSLRILQSPDISSCYALMTAPVKPVLRPSRLHSRRQWDTRLMITAATPGGLRTTWRHRFYASLYCWPSCWWQSDKVRFRNIHTARTNPHFPRTTAARHQWKTKHVKGRS